MDWDTACTWVCSLHQLYLYAFSVLSAWSVRKVLVRSDLISSWYYSPKTVECRELHIRIWPHIAPTIVRVVLQIIHHAAIKLDHWLQASGWRFKQAECSHSCMKISWSFWQNAWDCRANEDIDIHWRHDWRATCCDECLIDAPLTRTMAPIQTSSEASCMPQRSSETAHEIWQR